MSVDWSRWQPAPGRLVGWQRIPPRRCPRCGARWGRSGAARPRERSVTCTCTTRRHHTVWVCPEPECRAHAAEDCVDAGLWHPSTVGPDVAADRRFALREPQARPTRAPLDAPTAPGAQWNGRPTPAAPGRSGQPARRVAAGLEEAAMTIRDADDRAGRAIDRDVHLTTDQARLEGRLTLPDDAVGVVLFAHGSGSSRHSPRNLHVAEVLQRRHLGTLLLDLLTADEERHRANVFDVELLAGRLAGATTWLAALPEVSGLPLGSFGASTGAAAALWASTEPGGHVGAVVSRGGRPDLADERLSRVTAPTLLVVGGRDDVVLRLNRSALERLRCPRDLVVVPGATHLFEEPGALDQVADLAAAWFVTHLARAPR